VLPRTLSMLNIDGLWPVLRVYRSISDSTPLDKTGPVKPRATDTFLEPTFAPVHLTSCIKSGARFIFWGPATELEKLRCLVTEPDVQGDLKKLPLPPRIRLPSTQQRQES
jgi:hypothetical protein